MATSNAPDFAATPTSNVTLPELARVVRAYGESFNGSTGAAIPWINNYDGLGYNVQMDSRESTTGNVFSFTMGGSHRALVANNANGLATDYSITGTSNIDITSSGTIGGHLLVSSGLRVVGPSTFDGTVQVMGVSTFDSRVRFASGLQSEFSSVASHTHSITIVPAANASGKTALGVTGASQILHGLDLSSADISGDSLRLPGLFVSSTKASSGARIHGPWGASLGLRPAFQASSTPASSATFVTILPPESAGTVQAGVVIAARATPSVTETLDLISQGVSSRFALRVNQVGGGGIDWPLIVSFYGAETARLHPLGGLSVGSTLALPSSNYIAHFGAHGSLYRDVLFDNGGGISINDTALAPVRVLFLDSLSQIVLGNTSYNLAVDALAFNLVSETFGIFGATGSSQIAGGSKTAGAAYSTTVQSMVNILWDMAQAYGFIT